MVISNLRFLRQLLGSGSHLDHIGIISSISFPFTTSYNISVICSIYLNQFVLVPLSLKEDETGYGKETDHDDNECHDHPEPSLTRKTIEW